MGKKKIVFFGTEEQAEDIQKQFPEFEVKQFNYKEYNLRNVIPFTMAYADAYVFYPDCDYRELYTVISEKEVYHPLSQIWDIPKRHEKSLNKEQLKDLRLKNKKPVLLVGDENEWKEFEDILDHLVDKQMLRVPREHLYRHVKDEKEAAKAIEKHFGEIDNEVKKIRGARKRSLYSDFGEYQVYDERIDEHLKINGAGKPKYIVAVMGSATTKVNSILEGAYNLGKDLAEHGFGVINGGGNSGVMGAVTNGSKSILGSYTRGISASDLFAPTLEAFEPTYVNLFDRFSFDKDMPHRITTMCNSSDAVIIAQGGIGSMEELVQMLNLRMHGHHSMKYPVAGDKNGVKKPLVVLNEDGYYNKVLAKLSVAERKELIVVNNEREAVEAIQQYFVQHPKYVQTGQVRTLEESAIANFLVKAVNSLKDLTQKLFGISSAIESN